jgi:hypothetical protein
MAKMRVRANRRAPLGWCLFLGKGGRFVGVVDPAIGWVGGAAVGAQTEQVVRTLQRDRWP